MRSGATTTGTNVRFLTFGGVMMLMEVVVGEGKSAIEASVLTPSSSGSFWGKHRSSSIARRFGPNCQGKSR